MARVLAVDLGTSSLRAELFDEEARPLREVVRLPYEPGPALDPEPLVEAVRSAIAAAGAVDAVAYSCLWHSLLVLDADGRPLGPATTWLDRRASPDAVALARELDADEVHARTGAPLHPSFWPAQLRRLQRERARFTTVAALPDYLRLRLHGELATSVSIASGTGLYDVHRLQWDGELLDVLGLDESQLPPVRDNLVVIGDGAAATVGVGCVAGDRACLSVGTSGALRRVLERTTSASPGLFLYRLDRARYVKGGALSDGGNLLVWLARVLRTEVGDAVDRPPGALSVLPHFGGERSPGWHADAAGAISGLTFATTAEDVVQGAFEGISYRFAEIFDRLARTSEASALVQGNVEEVVATGRALAGRPNWAQLLADVLEVPVTLSAVPEASARGAALVALDLLDAPAPLGPRFEPRPDRAAAHRQARARLRAFYEATAAPTS